MRSNVIPFSAEELIDSLVLVIQRMQVSLRLFQDFLFLISATRFNFIIEH